MRKDSSAAPTFALPALAAGESAPSHTAGRWTWVNVWATWCHPCVDELARIYRFRDRLATEGAPADVVLLSVDASDDEVAHFAADHHEAHGSLRLSDVHTLPAVIASLGLDPGASIPIHAFVDPAGKLRCVRTGAIEDDDYDAVKGVLTQR